MWETSHPLSFAVAGYALAASIMPNLVLIAAGHLVGSIPAASASGLGSAAGACACYDGGVRTRRRGGSAVPGRAYPARLPRSAAAIRTPERIFMIAKDLLLHTVVNPSRSWKTSRFLTPDPAGNTCSTSPRRQTHNRVLIFRRVLRASTTAHRPGKRDAQPRGRRTTHRSCTTAPARA